MFDNYTTEGKILITLLSIVLLIVGFTLSAHTTVYLWKWHIASLFGLPLLTFKQALGLNIVLSWFMNIYTQPEKTQEEYIRRFVSVCITMPLMALFIGWLILQIP